MNDHHDQDIAGVVAPPPLIFAVPLALGVTLDRVRKHDPLPRSLARPAGTVLVAAGILLGLGAAPQFRRAGTPVNPHRPTTALVTGGSYRISRNPLYLSLALLYAGISLLAGSRSALRFLPGVLGIVNRGVIEREERYLEARFGDAYRTYKDRVRRWL